MLIMVMMVVVVVVVMMMVVVMKMMAVASSKNCCEVKVGNTWHNEKPLRAYYVNVSYYLTVILSAVPAFQVYTIPHFYFCPMINKDTRWSEQSYWDCSLQMLSWEYTGASSSWINKPGCYLVSDVWPSQGSE